MPTFKCNPTQEKFLQSRARFKFFIAGLGSGKTAVGSVQSIVKVGQGQPGVIVSPDLEHFKKSTWPELRKWIPWHWVVPSQRDRMSPEWEPYKSFQLVFKVGNQHVPVYCGGIRDEGSLRGPNVNWFWFDEGARKRDRKAFDILAGRIRIGNHPQGWVTTTPQGRGHWLYNVAVKQDFLPELLEEIRNLTGGGLVERFQCHTKENAANLDPVYVATLQALYTGDFARQELGGEFVAFEGLVYEAFGEHNIKTTADYRADRGPVEIAYDDGYSNPRAFLFIQRGDNGSVYVFDELYHSKHLGTECVTEAKNIAASYGIEHIEIAVGDPSAAELKEAFRRADIPARGAKCEVVEGIKRVRVMVQDGNGNHWLKVHPRCKNLLREIESYTYPDADSNRDAEKPIKENDHAMDALRYWAWLRWKLPR